MASNADTRGGGGEVAKNDVLYDERREEHYVAVAVTDDGITLRRRDTEYYVPHTAFAEWYDPARMRRNEEIPVETPDWIGTES